jgi:hypothetical protein
MATAFDTFDQYAGAAYAGQVRDLGMADIVSKLTDAAIGFGLAVVRGDHDNSIALPAAEETAFVGITVRMTAWDNTSSDTAQYPVGKEASVIRTGRVWAVATDGCAAGESVYVTPVTGALASSYEVGEQLVGATWETTAAAGELAVIQLKG